ncbi:MAG: beta-lactamase family protein [Candidatus Eremiobacteraeota bacterium]|nr:beta-lactamase family protein [Candidatus Eremiobacteraeota bacterium]
MRTVTVLALVLIFGGVALAQSASVPASSALAADTPSKTPSGATFTAPKAWSVRTQANLVVIAAPEGDTNVAIVDVATAADAGAAAAAAWKLYRPEAMHPVKLISPLSTRNGWEERRLVEYETSPNEKAAIQVLALRRGVHWTVFILDGHDATVEKRVAAINLVAGSLRPAGYSREDFAGRKAHPLDSARVQALKSFIRSSMQQLEVPGVSIALFDRGHVVFEGGFGVRSLGHPEPVDANTLYMIASNTKGLTTLLLAKLVDEGKLSWDEPVTQAYPSFRLGSSATTKQVLMKHLVCACTGLPRKDLQWILNTNPSTPASDTFVQLAATEPTSGFGEVFQYNNLMASAAGFIAGHIVYPDRELGAAYDLAMQKIIFDPLGMNSTTFDMARALGNPNHAHPHSDDIDGRVTAANPGINDAILPYRPAGAAWSSVHDMIRYVQDELTPGRLPNGQQFISVRNVLTRRLPNVPIGENSYYGMGVMVDKTWGVPVIHHGGDLVGFHSDWFAIPAAGVGAVILTNSDRGVDIRGPFMRRILEVLYDGKPEAAAQITAAAALERAQIQKERQRLVVPAAGDAASRLASRYVNADLGHIDVTHDGSNVAFSFGMLKSVVASRVNDDKTVSFITIEPGLEGFEFVAGSRDGRRTLTIRDAQHEYVYTET